MGITRPGLFPALGMAAQLPWESLLRAAAPLVSRSSSSRPAGGHSRRCSEEGVPVQWLQGS